MPLAAYGRPLHIRPLSGAINVPRQKQVAPPTLAGWGRADVMRTDTLAKPTANLESARPPVGVPMVNAWANANAPERRGVTIAQANHIAAPSTKGTTLVGAPSAAQRIPVGDGDSTVVRTPAGTRIVPSVTTQPRQLIDSTSKRVTEATPGYTPRGPKTIELVETGGVWSPGIGYQPSATPTAPTTTPAATGGGSAQLATTSAEYTPPSADTSNQAAAAAAAAPAAGRPWWHYALGVLVVGGVVYAASR